jgi:hypothetical protein
MRGEANGKILWYFPAVIDERLKNARLSRGQPMAHVGSAFAYFDYFLKMILILNISRIVPSKERITLSLNKVNHALHPIATA